MELYSALLQSPIGAILIIANQNELLELKFETANSRDLIENPLLIETKHQLKAYFEGKLKTFNLPINPEGTPFEKSIWEKLLEIPFAETISYTELSIHHPKAIRAIASANGKNKLPIIIPCHRVIGKNGQLVGYSGEMWRKRWLIDHENEVAQKGQTRLKF